MRNFTFILVFTFITSSIALAQLADGSTAPNFTITDIDGTSHTLYDILDEGKPVLLDLFATWCGPCWDFAATGVFDQFDELYGPNGDNSVFTLAVESDPTTAVNTLYNSSYGNWTSVIHYTLANDNNIADAYALAYYPTIYLICPDRTVKEIGQGPSTSTAYWNVQTLAQEVFINTCPAPTEGLNAMMQSYDADLVACGGGKIEPIVTLMNMGTENMTACDIQTIVAGNVLSTYQWTGNLATFSSVQLTLAEIPSNTSNVSFNVVMSGDLDSSDDDISVQIESATESHAYIHVQVDADYYAGETTWDIRNANGSIVFSGSYQSGTADQWGGGGPDANVTHNHFTELSEGCYTFTAYDSYGDGQTGTTSAPQQGSVTLSDGNGLELFFVTGNWESESTSYFEVTSGVGIEEVLENNISIFPNPAFGSTSISLNLVESNDVFVELVNALGQRVFVQEYALTSGLNTIEIPLNDLSDGMYFMNLQVSDQLITEKLHISK